MIPKIFKPFKDILNAGFLGKPHDFSDDEYRSHFFQNYPFTPVYKQVHGKTIYDAQEFIDSSIQLEADGIYTKKQNITCTTNTADCIGGLFFNPLSHEIAAVHAGWRGLELKIFTEYLSRFTSEEKQEIRIALSPSLGPCCSEFKDPYNETPKHFHSYISIRDGKYFIDLWAIAKQELLENGIPPEHIEMPSTCTKCDRTEKWWSHRNKERERNVSWIVLK